MKSNRRYKFIWQNKKRFSKYLFLLPSVVGVAGFVLIPFLDVVRRSFTGAVSGKFLGIANYQKVFVNRAFLLAAGNTMKFVGVSLPILLGAGLLLALMQIHFMGTDSAFWVLVGSYVWKNLGYTLVLWLAGLKTIPEEILEAAKVDGAGGFQRFSYMILPQLKGSAYTITVLSFLNFFKAFREVYLVSGSYPHESIYCSICLIIGLPI